VGDPAGRAVTLAVNSAADAVADVAESIGHGLADGLSSVGEAARVRLPTAGTVARAVLRWAGGIAAAVFDLVGAVVKGLFDLVGGVIGALITLGAAVLHRDRRMARLGGRSLAISIGGPVVVVVGKLIEVVQAIVGVTPRRLHDDERDTLWRVYRGSVALYNVRVVEGWCGVFQLNRRPFTLGNTIYMKARRDRETLVHECGHVWQNQHEGPRYTLDAVLAQLLIKPSPHAAYRWSEEPSRGRPRWVEFNKEAQAEFLSDLFGENEAFYDADPVADGQVFHWADVDLTEFATTTVALVRSRRSRRFSCRFNPAVSLVPTND
jgi:hypothetical protein